MFHNAFWSDIYRVFLYPCYGIYVWARRMVLEVGVDCKYSMSDLFNFIIKKEKIVLNKQIIFNAQKNRHIYLEEARKRLIYGYCTGLGSLYKRVTNCPEGWEEVVLEEHSASVGDRVASIPLTRLFLLIRLIQLTRLPAPVRPAVIERIRDALNLEIYPLIHYLGSVGASGDLSPSAEAFRCLFYGKGRAWMDGSIIECNEALRKAGLEPLELEPGETLALINNTAWSTALCLYSLYSLEKLLNEAMRVGGLAIEISGANPEHYDPEMIKAKNCPEGAEVAERLRVHAREMRILQAPYSIRCLPQILGALNRAYRHSLQMVLDEVCGASENPAVVNGRVLHGCNFHSIRVGLACDYARIITSNLANLVDRLAAQLLRSEITGLPEFLAGEKSSVGLMITQYTTAALAGISRSYSAPATINTIPTSGLQEDFVPMTPASTILLSEQIDSLIASIAVLSVLEKRIERLSREIREPGLGLQEDIIKAYRLLKNKILPGGVSPFVNETDYLGGNITVK